MTPEEYERLKDAEKEHLKKLKELKQAVRVLERQKKIQSELEKMSRASDDALQAQSDAVQQLALETAHQEARLDLALESTDTEDLATSDEALDDELRSARAQALVERLKHSMVEEEIDSDEEATSASASETSRAHESGTGPDMKRPAREEDAANPTTEARPEKTIGRM